jgi:hypothetical protein
LVHASLKQRLGRTDRLLVVSAAPRAFARRLGSLCDVVESIDLDSLASAVDKTCEADRTFDACAYIVDGERLPNDETVFKRISRMLKPGGFLVVLVTAALDRQLLDSHLDLAGLERRWLQCGIRVEDTRYVPAGPVRVTLARALAATIRAGRASPRAALPLLLTAGALIAGAVLGCNLLIRSRRCRRSPRGHYSSILVAGRSPATAAMSAMSAIDGQYARGYDDPELAAPRQAGPRLAGAPEADLRVESRLAIRRRRRAGGRLPLREMPGSRWTTS